MKELDPEGVFQSPPWFDEVINEKETAKSDGCALEGQCICSEDRHCRPDKGYVCQHAWPCLQGSKGVQVRQRFHALNAEILLGKKFIF